MLATEGIIHLRTYACAYFIYIGVVAVDDARQAYVFGCRDEHNPIA